MLLPLMSSPQSSLYYYQFALGTFKGHRVPVAQILCELAALACHGHSLFCVNHNNISACCLTKVCKCCAETGPWVWLTTVGAVRSDLFSDQNNFTGNQANTSGAVIYSTDLDSTWLKCQNGNESSKVTCPEWDEGYPNLLSDGALGYQYGPGIAYPPKTVMSDMLPDQHLEIISNGKSPLPMPRIWVVDQVGQSVSMPSLEANVTVVSLDPLLLPDGIQNATLLNQVQATADANGSIIFNGTVLLAAPAIYNLTISVAEVSFPPSYQLPSKLPHVAVHQM